MFLIEGMFNTVFTSCINRIFQLFFNHNILKMSHKLFFNEQSHCCGIYFIVCTFVIEILISMSVSQQLPELYLHAKISNVTD
jgi:hypothetical protein